MYFGCIELEIDVSQCASCENKLQIAKRSQCHEPCLLSIWSCLPSWNKIVFKSIEQNRVPPQTFWWLRWWDGNSFLKLWLHSNNTTKERIWFSFSSQIWCPISEKKNIKLMDFLLYILLNNFYLYLMRIKFIFKFFNTNEQFSLV